MSTPLAHRFAYHKPQDAETVWAHERVRDLMGDVAEDFGHILPQGRESALALTKLEEAMFWANAAIARAGS